MKPLTAEEITEFRKLIAHLRIPEARANTRELMLASGASRVLDEVERSRALLTRIEWGLLRDECPACGGPMEHKPSCELAALLGG